MFKNVIYKDKTFNIPQVSEFTINFHLPINCKFKHCLSNKITTIKNVYVINSLHYCYSHALIDGIFTYFWTISEIKKIHNNFTDFYIFIVDDVILRHKKLYLPIIDNLKNMYKSDVWNDMLNILSNNIFFEHLLDEKSEFLFENCFFDVNLDGINIKRSPWNCMEYYPGRNIRLCDVTYNDDDIYKNLSIFVDHVKNKYSIGVFPECDQYNVIIIHRKSNRFWNDIYLKGIIESLKKNEQVTSIKHVVLEGMSFKDQISLFSSHNCFIFRHGSCLSNLLWVPNNSFIFDVDIYKHRPNIVKRLAQVTNSKVFSIDYNMIDYSLFSRFSL